MIYAFFYFDDLQKNEDNRRKKNRDDRDEVLFQFDHRYCGGGDATGESNPGRPAADRGTGETQPQKGISRPHLRGHLLFIFFHF